MKIKLLVFLVISAVCHSFCFYFATQYALEKEEKEWVLEEIGLQTQEITATGGTNMPLEIETSAPQEVEDATEYIEVISGYDSSIDYGIIYLSIFVSLVIHGVAFYSLSRTKRFQTAGGINSETAPLRDTP